jgi:hypothetical protein
LAQGVSPGYANLETLSPFRGGRRGIKARSVVPGALGDFSFAHPPLKRWAIIFRLATRDWRERDAVGSALTYADLVPNSET